MSTEIRNAGGGGLPDPKEKQLVSILCTIEGEEFIGLSEGFKFLPEFEPLTNEELRKTIGTVKGFGIMCGPEVEISEIPRNQWNEENAI